MTHGDPVPRFRLAATGKVQQRFPDQPPDEFDPAGWATYTKDQRTVQACRIPRGFIVGADFCRDGWLVLDGKQLKAISDSTFTRDYELTLLTGDMEDSRNGLKVVD